MIKIWRNVSIWTVVRKQERIIVLCQINGYILFRIVSNTSYKVLNIDYIHRNLLHVWTLFNKLETIAVQQEILVSLVDKFASVSTRKSGSCTGSRIRQGIPAQSVTALLQGKNPTLNPLQYHKMLVYTGTKSRYRGVYPAFVPNIIPTNL